MPTIIKPMPVLTIAAFTATMAARVTVAIVVHAVDHMTFIPVKEAAIADRIPVIADLNPATKVVMFSPFIVVTSEAIEPRSDTVDAVAALLFPTYMSMAAASDATTVLAPPSISTKEPIPEIMGDMTSTIPVKHEAIP